MTPTPNLQAAAMRASAAAIADDYAHQPSTGDQMHDGGWDGASICIAHDIIALPLEATPAELLAEAVKLNAVANAMEACRIIDEAVKAGHESPMDLILHLLTATEHARAALLWNGQLMVAK